MMPGETWDFGQEKKTYHLGLKSLRHALLGYEKLHDQQGSSIMLCSIAILPIAIHSPLTDQSDNTTEPPIAGHPFSARHRPRGQGDCGQASRLCANHVHISTTASQRDRTANKRGAEDETRKQ